jgi:hypothetical protein
VCETVVEGLTGLDADRAMDGHREVKPEHLNRVKNVDGTNYRGFRRVSLDEFLKA